MKRSLVLGVLMGVILFSQTHQASADNYYRINMRAYRKMLHYQLPHPFADRFWGVVDNQLLQPGGAFEQFLKAFLAKNLSVATQETQASDTMIAKAPVVPDPLLSSAAAKVRAMCAKRGITYIEIPETPATTVQPPAGDLTDLDPNFSIPAPARPDFQNPADLP